MQNEKRIIATGHVRCGEICLATPEQKLATFEAITSLIDRGDYTRYLQSFSPEAREAAKAIIDAGRKAAEPI